MLLDESEFMEIKEEFVEQVLTRLRALARSEAELLARLHQHHPQSPLPEMSIQISEVMSRTADAVINHWDEMANEQLENLKLLVVEHLPAVLIEQVGENLWGKMPSTYLKWMMAKTLAARIVYREGFEYLETMEDDDLAVVALRYLDLEQERKTLIDEITESNLNSKEIVSTLLRYSGIFSTMGRRKNK